MKKMVDTDKKKEARNQNKNQRNMNLKKMERNDEQRMKKEGKNKTELYI